MAEDPIPNIANYKEAKGLKYDSTLYKLFLQFLKDRSYYSNGNLRNDLDSDDWENLETHLYGTHRRLNLIGIEDFYKNFAREICIDISKLSSHEKIIAPETKNNLNFLYTLAVALDRLRNKKEIKDFIESGKLPSTETRKLLLRYCHKDLRTRFNEVEFAQLKNALTRSHDYLIQILEELKETVGTSKSSDDTQSVDGDDAAENISLHDNIPNSNRSTPSPPFSPLSNISYSPHGSDSEKLQKTYSQNSEQQKEDEDNIEEQNNRKIVNIPNLRKSPLRAVESPRTNDQLRTISPVFLQKKSRKREIDKLYDCLSKNYLVTETRRRKA